MGSNGCPYTGNIFTVKNVLQVYSRIFLHKNSVSLPFSCLIFFFFLWLEYFTVFSLSKISLKNLTQFSSCKMFSDFLPAAPAAALAASERPSLPTVGTTVAAARSTVCTLRWDEITVYGDIQGPGDDKQYKRFDICPEPSVRGVKNILRSPDQSEMQYIS